MKYILFFSFLVCTTVASAQRVRKVAVLNGSHDVLSYVSAGNSYQVKRAILPWSLSFVSGALWGGHETINYHWYRVEARYPNINQRFWNPAISWETSKEIAGYKFDAKHLLASGTQIGMLSAGVTITLGERKPWWHYAIDAGGSFAAYSLGNYAVYNVWFR
jgi:hypothetical protein